jgi:hypothetical protein
MMLRQILVAASMASMLVAGVRAQDKPEPLEVVVLSPPGLPVKEATFSIANEQRRVTFDAKGRATATFLSHPRGTVVPIAFTIEKADNQLQGRSWKTTGTLNGSGHLDYQILGNGKGQIDQWPIVTWLSSGARLDVALNERTIGSTRLEKGVAPSRAHTVNWRNGNKAVCTHQLTLEPNVERTYSCDPATGRVSEVDGVKPQ